MARILIVEDDATLRHDLGGKLGDWGHEVLQASDGVEGFDVITASKPDLVLSDIKMPRQSGLDLVKRVTGLGAPYADMTFLFITALSSSRNVVRGFDSGADDYITKPINYQVLKAKIDSHVRRKKQLTEKVELETMATSMSSAMVNGLMFTAMCGVFGCVVLIALYWIKAALGINIFQDTHASALFW